MPNRFDKIIPVLLLVIFIAITLPGISWGAPSFWHPDELIRRVDKMVQGGYQIDGTYFNHPFLPKHIYLGIGKLVYGLGHSRYLYIQAARLLNVLLGGAIIALVYLLARSCRAGVLGGVLAAAFTLSSSEIALNARIAHNDIFLGFFIIIAVIALVKFRSSGNIPYIYAAFFAIGLAASSKYNGASLAVAPVIIILLERHELSKKGAWKPLWILFAGIIFMVLGFLIGTPETVSQLSFFVASTQTSLIHHAEFNRQPDTLIGIFGVWESLYQSLGASSALIFSVASIYHLGGIFNRNRSPWSETRSSRKAVGVILLSILALVLPMLLVYNYPPRFFLPIIPLLAVLTGILLEDIVNYSEQRGLRLVQLMVLGISAALLLFSMLRVISIALLFTHDARIPAGVYVAKLPTDSSVEYTFYPPTIPQRHFSRRHNYPLFFPKSMLGGEPDPNWAGSINLGEKGLEERQTDFLIVDSLTTKRFEDQYICTSIPNECEFFQRLLAGETDYRLLAEFDYHLPSFLPQLSPFFLNPTIWIFGRSQ